MDELPTPSNELVTSHTEVIGGQVDLPGRFPIFTDGLMFRLLKHGIEEIYKQQCDLDAYHLADLKQMVERMITHTRKTLKADGQMLEDWNVTVTVAVHHKGQATEFWLGDAPNRKIVDKSLPENLSRPEGAQKIEVKR